MILGHLPRRAFCFGLLFFAGLVTLGDLTTQAREDQEGEAKAARADATGLVIRLVDQDQGDRMQRFVVSGLSDARLRRLAESAAEDPRVWLDTMVVTVVSDNAGKPRPMLGDYAIDGTAIAFSPRFPLGAGTTYRVQVFAEEDRRKAVATREFAIAARPAAVPTRLLAVFPSSSVLPENQLKFYLHFSSPMSRGEAYRRVKLIDQNGRQVEFPFLELGEELWDPSGKRFTLFFDPGRIKRGLKPRELFGPALEEGRSYTLVVDRQWRDARGRPLRETHRKKFKVVKPDDTQPDPSNWQLVRPAAGTTQPLVVSFGEPLDHAMLQRVLTVAGTDGAAAAGRIVISKDEQQWSFQPDNPWQAGDYALVVDTALEDLAGNSIGRPFEVDVFEKVDRATPPATVRIPFEIGP